ncbi:hypothetical protein NQ318_000478 [Aromia moschata]|uniref:Uncharacterized protein n=1 Tax=Aromia moschata TaxID=1265417 RepID=A0AAV8YTE5_9CUCU|nr:hypothetical protein NQ318_000478 [Aromia moschata]
MLSARCERVATSLIRTVSGDTFPTLSSLDKPVGRSFLVKLGKWFKQLKEGRETIEDDPRPGRPSTSKTDENIENVGIDKECVRQILHESFNIRKVCAKMVPKLLTPEQKESRLNICADILNNIDSDPGLLDTVRLNGTRLKKCGSG